MTTATASFAARTVFRIGYGALQLERLHDRRGEAVALLRHAVELGVDHVDTAEFYGFGFANDVIREALRPEDDVLVVTKVGADPNLEGTCRCVWHSVPSSCAPASRTTCAASASTGSRSSTCAAWTPAPGCVPRGTRSSLSTTSSR
jgi:Aldo/keto reductase family